MRLRLLVRRNGVPDVKLLWNVADDTCTIFQLLTQINEVIIIESGEWGLEDYAVEYTDGGFECLHFQVVSHILKDDDQILIRPLSSDDLKKRRLGGRHQISMDGKHMIDGVPFGRPRFAVPRLRPTVLLPPRKRARISYYSSSDEDVDDEDDDDDEDDSLDESLDESLEGDSYSRPAQLLLEGVSEAKTTSDPNHHSKRKRPSRPRARFAPHPDDSEGEDSDDFQPRDTEQDEGDESSDGEDMSTDDEGSLDAELTALAVDNAMVEDGSVEKRFQALKALPHNRPAKEKTKSPLNASADTGLSLQDVDKIASLSSSFPAASITNIERTLIMNKRNLKRTYQTLASDHRPSLSYAQAKSRLEWLSPSSTPNPMSPAPQPQPQPQPQSTARNSTAALPRHHLDEHSDRENTPTRPLFSPAHNSSSNSPGWDTAKSNMSNDSESSSEEESENQTSDDSSSSSSSGDDDGDESTGHGPENDARESSTSTSESDSDSDSSSDSDSDANSKAELTSPGQTKSSDVNIHSGAESSKRDTTVKRLAINTSHSDVTSSDSDSADTSSSDDSSSEDSSSESDSDSDSPVSSKPPMQTSLHALPTMSGITPEISSEIGAEGSLAVPLTKTQKRNARRRLQKRAMKTDDQSQEPTSISKQDELLARKEALLAAMGATPSDNNKRKRPEEEDEDDENEETSGNEPRSTNGPASEPPPVPADAGKDTTPTVPGNPESSGSTARRLRLDLGAGRRLVFGALGLRNPKNKTDEDRVRTQLMEGVRPLVTAPTVEQQTPIDAATISAPPEEEDADAWREKIVYRAVECCRDGVVLSEPPFPFVQRWDPQQRYDGWSKKGRSGGKRKRSQRNQAEYYGDEEPYYDGESYDYHEGGDVSQLDYDDPVTATHQSLADDGKEPSNGEVDDLPGLPTDLTTFPELQPEDATAGCVITWKKLSLSKHTNWQPTIRDITAIIVSIDGSSDDPLIHVALARRDRLYDQNEKVYDQETGERIYDRFEGPDMDEDDAEMAGEDEGLRSFQYSDMMQPRIVQGPTDTLIESMSRSADIIPAFPQSDDLIEDSFPVTTSLITDKATDEGASFPATDPLSLDLRVSESSAPSSPKTGMAALASAAGNEGPASYSSSPPASMAATTSRGLPEAPPLATAERSSSRAPSRQPTSSPAKITQDPTAEPATPPNNDDSLSGRQPDPNYSLEIPMDLLYPLEPDAGAAAPNPIDDESEPTGSNMEDTLVTPKREQATDSWMSGTSNSDSFFPSIEQILRRASASKAEKAKSNAEKGKGPEPSRLGSVFLNLFPNASQPAKISPPPLRNRARQGRGDISVSSPTEGKRPAGKEFTIPLGSHVIDLSESSPPPAEEYADDSIDETYNDNEKAPTATGERKNKSPTKNARNRRAQNRGSATRGRGGGVTKKTKKSKTPRVSKPLLASI